MHGLEDYVLSSCHPCTNEKILLPSEFVEGQMQTKNMSTTKKSNMLLFILVLFTNIVDKNIAFVSNP